MSHQTIYLSMYSQVNISPGETLIVGKVAEIESISNSASTRDSESAGTGEGSGTMEGSIDDYSGSDIKEKISHIPLSIDLTEEGEDRKILSSLFLIKLIKLYYPEVDIQVLGLTDTIIKTKKNSPSNDPFRLAFIYLVCLLLFIGSAMAIMNFHADVNMPSVHQQIFLILTGEENRNPLAIQIPYSIGIGLGMFVFFNRLFKKRINREPSPLEVEMFLYEENVNKYLRASQKKIKKQLNHNKQFKHGESQINNKDQE